MRINRNSPNFTPVRRDFDFRLAFIDFGASVKFLTDDYHVPCNSAGPPPPFLSPEQAEGEDKDGATFDLFAADVYGLGQILIYEVSGSNTLSRITLITLQASHTETLLPSEYNALLSEMTAEEPSRRPSAAEGLKRVQEMMVTI
jgi:serine/threonine protein kinase